MFYKFKVRLTKGTDELSLYSPGDCLDQGGRSESSKQHVVQEDDVEVPQPVIPTKVSQQIKAGDTYNNGGQRKYSTCEPLGQAELHLQIHSSWPTPALLWVVLKLQVKLLIHILTYAGLYTT